MSTFGKKALTNWNYYLNDTPRYFHTNKEVQLEILKKWYPLGEFFLHRNKLIEIVDYVLKFDSYFIVYFNKGVKYESSPMCLKPTKEFLRNIKLKEILKDE